ncbi:ATP-binding protein [Rhodovibrio sodomensis]|uniref:ATP-binding protein n=1 Tax=Rhodovibrio sodomensis TaxID=1088 RepID=UPI003F584DE7
MCIRGTAAPVSARRAGSDKVGEWLDARAIGDAQAVAEVLPGRNAKLVAGLEQAEEPVPAIPAAIDKLDRFHLLVLDDLSYVRKTQAETSVLFELIAARYERRSIMITANQPFGEWDSVFPDKAMTVAAIDRLVHHATILEMNVESYRRRTALDRTSSEPEAG